MQATPGATVSKPEEVRMFKIDISDLVLHPVDQQAIEDIGRMAYLQAVSGSIDLTFGDTTIESEDGDADPFGSQ